MKKGFVGLLCIVLVGCFVYFAGTYSSNGKNVKYKLTKVTENSEETIFEINIKNHPIKFKKEKVYISAAPDGGKCIIKLGRGKCFSAPFYPRPITKSQCEFNKEKLGIKGCYYQKDYWAGAVKQCGGVNKMPSMSELAMIASAFYKGSPAIGERKSIENLAYNSDAVKVLNLRENNFCLWSGEEYGNLGLSASGRCFFPSYTHFFVDYYKKFDSVMAVCLTND